jgi:hypothetical protein
MPLTLFVYKKNEKSIKEVRNAKSIKEGLGCPLLFMFC